MFEDATGVNNPQPGGPTAPTKATVEATAARASVLGSHDLICTHDLEGRILSVNSAACEALGIPPSILCRMTIQDLLPAGTAARFGEYLRQLDRHGFAAGTMNVTTLDGDHRVWEYRNTLDMDEKPAPLVRGVARDVTEREAAFKAMRRSEEHFRSIIENASDIIAIVGFDGQLRYESPSVQRVLGYPPHFLVGMAFVDLIHPDDAARAADFLHRQISDPAAIQTVELAMRHYSGAWRSFEIVAKNLVSNADSPAIVMNARDITERKLLQAQLVQANRLGGLGRLAATVAHEFNNVLMGMQPFAELLQRPDAAPAMVAKGAWHIGNSVQRGKRIVMDILRFTQPYVPVRTAFDLGEWWDTFAPEAEVVLGNMISLVSLIPRHLYVAADRTQLSQVLANLVANARDAMPRGGTLTVEATHLDPEAMFLFGVVPHPDRFVQVSVHDTGCGMRPETMERAFEPLYTTKERGGTGLGLAVAHQILTQHEGYIFVESEPGLGSTFHLFLPVATDRPADPAIAASIRRPAASRVLVIEDEALIAEGITMLLEQEGMTVATIGSGFQAAKAIASFQPDLVLLDYGLPGMDGIEVYALIRKLAPLVPIIFATGHGDRRVLHNDLHDPRTRFLQKPFAIGELLELMFELGNGGQR
ncbi:MAG: PAS domain S-box protein [Acidobacteriota bacterium]